MSETEDKDVGGRPTIFTQELADKICDAISSSSFGVKRLCKLHEEFPSHETIYKWKHRHKSFADQYAQAKRDQADMMADEVMDISDDGRNDWMESLSDDEQGICWKLNGEHVQRSRLRIDTRKWVASKLLPKVYGNNDKNQDDDKNQMTSLVAKLIDKLG